MCNVLMVLEVVLVVLEVVLQLLLLQLRVLVRKVWEGLGRLNWHRPVVNDHAVGGQRWFSLKC